MRLTSKRGKKKMGSKKNNLKKRTWGLKYLVLAIVLPALAVGGVLLATRDYTAVNVGDLSYHHTVVWDTNSFDETVWLAVGEISKIKDRLPEEVNSYYVKIQSADEEMPAIQFSFSRSSLARLMAGEIASEDFMREYVEFY